MAFYSEARAGNELRNARLAQLTQLLWKSARRRMLTMKVTNVRLAQSIRLLCKFARKLRKLSARLQGHPEHYFLNGSWERDGNARTPAESS